MSRSSGTYSLPAGNPVVTGTVISVTWANNTLNDISNEITNSLPRDGTAPPLANIPFGNYKITGLGAATLGTDAVQYQQVQSGATNYLTSVAGADTITANLSSPTLAAYAAGNTFRFVAAGTNTGAVTLNINGLGAKDVTKNGATALIAGDITSSATIEVVYDGARFQLIGTAKILNEAQGADIASAGTVNLTTATGNYVHITGTTTITAITLAQGAERTVVFDGALTLTNGASLLLPTGANITTASGDTAVFRGEASSVVRCVSYDRKNGTSLATATATATDKIQPITASVAANALTLTLNPTTLDFRDANRASGTVNTRTVAAAISLVISSGSTLGTINAIESRIAVLAIDNAGTVELAAVNLAGGAFLTETGVISTTAEGGAGAADSATVIYSTTARTNVPYRVVGYVESTQATAGTWATAPSEIQGYGGQAFAAMSSLGYGQTYQNVTGSRASATTYYNTTGKPITILVTFLLVTNGVTKLTVNGSVIAEYNVGNSLASVRQQACAVIPVGGSYSINEVSSYVSWYELR